MSSSTPYLLATIDPSWRDDADYDIGSLKAYEGKIYLALQRSGPNTNAGVCCPDESPEQWQLFPPAGDGVTVTDGKVGVDDTVVRTNGAQTIYGTKTFDTDVVIKASSRDMPNLDLQFRDSVIKGTTPTGTVHAGMIIYDSTGNTSGSAINTLASVHAQYRDDGSICNRLISYEPVANSVKYAELGIMYPATGSPYAYSAATPASAIGNEIVTANYLHSHDSGVVHATGNETISGHKTLTDGLTVEGTDIIVRAPMLNEGPNVDLQFADTVVKGTPPPSDNVQAGIVIYDSTGNANGGVTNSLAAFQMWYGTDNVVRTHMRAFQPVAEGGKYAELSVYYPPDGDPYAIAPKTRANAAGNDIVTVNYLKSGSSGCVHTTNEEDISGVKNFHSNMVVVYDHPVVRLALSESTKGAVPSKRAYGEIWVQAASAYENPTSHNNDTYGYFGASTENDGSDRIYMRAMKNELGSGSYGEMAVVYPATGNPYAVAPRTRETPVDNEIITYDFLKKYVAEAIAQSQQGA